MPEKEGQRLRIITLLSTLWGYYPDERIGQLLANTIGSKSEFYITDDQFEETLIKDVRVAAEDGLEFHPLSTTSR